jgi:hypothetical protein
MAYSVDVQIFSTGLTYHETVALGDDTPGNVTAAYGWPIPSPSASRSSRVTGCR